MYITKWIGVQIKLLFQHFCRIQLTQIMYRYNVINIEMRCAAGTTHLPYLIINI